MAKNFNKQQKEILARKLGYDGPMNMFEQFVKSDPAMERKYNTVVEKYMARGGMVKKYQEGGAVTQDDTISQLNKQIEDLKASTQQERTKYGEQMQALQGQLNALNEFKLPPEKEAQLLNRVYQDYLNTNKDAIAREEGKAAYFSDLSTKINNFLQTAEPGQKLDLPRNPYSNRGQNQPYNFVLDDPQKPFSYEQRKAFTDQGYSVVDSKFIQDYLNNNIIPKQQESISAAQTIKSPETALQQQRDIINERIGQETAALRSARQAEIEAEQERLKQSIIPLVDKSYQQQEGLLNQINAINRRNFEAGRGIIPAPQQPAQVADTGTTPQPTVAAETTVPAGGETTPTVTGTTPAAQPVTTPTTGGTTATTTAPVGDTGTATPTTTDTTTTPTTTATTTAPSQGGMTGVQMANIPTTNTVPRVNIPQVTAATVPTEPGQMVAPTGAPEQAAQIQGAIVPGTAQVTPTAPQAAATMQAATATGAVSGELAGLQPAQGAVSQQAQVQAATMEPTSTALAGLQAAQTTAGQVQGAPTRSLVAGELVEGPTVDRAAVEAALAQNEAAQGVVTEDMTVQGQLAKLTSNFEANNPPSWAAGALRNATAVMAQRGLAASSLAGQALIQATIESALPIASADAQIYREMGIQNLTNKQQMAVLSAQQRAAFLGQEFDQAFQTRVTNAATISEIANLNFSAKQQIALENARLAESVNLANLNNRQALVMANAAQIATLETANLNNRQQANVLNAQAFLQMDLTNLSNQQQTALFKSQSMIQSILSDQAAENAARQFNASSVNQVNQFYDGLTAQIKQFNATQANAMNQFNVSQINSVAEFNASQQNARDQFNAEYRRIIDQSNAEWRRNIALADTAAINRANEVNATAALGISTIEYNNLWQTYRDNIEYAWKTGENALDRENELARQVLAKQATIEAAKFQIEAAKYQALGSLAAQVFDKGGIAAGIGGAIMSFAGGAKGVAAGIGNIFTSSSTGYTQIPNQSTPGQPGYGWEYFSDGSNNVTISPEGVYYYNDQMVWSPNMPLNEDPYIYDMQP